MNGWLAFAASSRQLQSSREGFPLAPATMQGVLGLETLRANLPQLATSPTPRRNAPRRGTPLRSDTNRSAPPGSGSPMHGHLHIEQSSRKGSSATADSLMLRPPPGEANMREAAKAERQ